MDDKQRVIINEAKLTLEAMAQKATGTFSAILMDSLNAVIGVAEARQAEIERLKNEGDVLRRAAMRNPLMDFFAEQQKEADKPQQGPWVGNGDNIISRK